MSGLNSAADSPFYPAFFFFFTLKWLNSLPVILTVNPVLMRKGRRPRTWKKVSCKHQPKVRKRHIWENDELKSCFLHILCRSAEPQRGSSQVLIIEVRFLFVSVCESVPAWPRPNMSIKKRKQSVTEYFLHFVDPATLFLFLVGAATLIAVPGTIDGVTQAKSHSGPSGPGSASTKRPSLTWH